MNPALSQILQWLVFPPGTLVLGLAAGGAAALAGRRRLALALLALPIVQTLILGLPWVANAIVAPLERDALAQSRAAASQPLPRVAAVLGGAVGFAGPGDPEAEAGYDLSGAADRVVKGAQLWREGRLDRLILAGGTGKATSEAELMARFAEDLGVPRGAMLLEGESRNTRENAQRVAALMRAQGLGSSVALVTSAIHVPRAMAEFRCAGLAPVAVPAEYEALGGAQPIFRALVPSLGAVDRSQRGLKEWLGATLGGCGPEAAAPP